MRTLTTPLGGFWIDDASPTDTRVGVDSVTTVDNYGPNSTYAWSLDQEEALVAAANASGGKLDLLVPGGFRLTPGEALPQFIEALSGYAATRTLTSRMTPPRG